MYIEVTDKIKPKNNNDFKIIDIQDVDYNGMAADVKIEKMIKNIMDGNFDLKGYATKDFVLENLTTSNEDIKKQIDKKISHPVIEGKEGQVLTIDQNNCIVWKTPDLIDEEKILNIKQFPVTRQDNKIVTIYISAVSDSGVYIVPKDEIGLIPLSIEFKWIAVNGDLVYSTFIGDCRVFSVFVNIDGDGKCILSDGITSFEYKIGDTGADSSVRKFASVLKTNNKIPYEPKDEYNPATVKYVDQAIEQNKPDLSIYAKTADIDEKIDDKIKDIDIDGKLDKKVSLPEVEGKEGQVLSYIGNGKVEWSEKDSEDSASKEYVDNSIEAIKDGASETFNTFKKAQTGILNNRTDIQKLSNNLSNKMDKPKKDGYQDQLLSVDKDGNPVWINKDVIDLSNCVDYDYVDNRIKASVNNVIYGTSTTGTVDNNLNTISKIAQAIDNDKDFSKNVYEKIESKISMPIIEGEEGQILSLDAEGNAVWVDKPTIEGEITGFATQQDITNALNDKISAPEQTGKEGQVLTIGEDGNPTWMDIENTSGGSVQLIYASISEIDDMFN